MRVSLSRAVTLTRGHSGTLAIEDPAFFLQKRQNLVRKSNLKCMQYLDFKICKQIFFVLKLTKQGYTFSLQQRA